MTSSRPTTFRPATPSLATLRQCSLKIIRLHRRDLPSWCFRRTATTVPFMSYGVFRPGRPGRSGDGLPARPGPVVRGLHAAEEAMTRKTTKLVREGRYAAEVRVELIEESGGWAPYLSIEDALKLDAVRQALRQGDVADAAKHGQVFELLPVSA